MLTCPEVGSTLSIGPSLRYEISSSAEVLPLLRTHLWTKIDQISASDSSAPTSPDSFPTSPNDSAQPGTAPNNHSKAATPAIIAGATVGAAVLILLLGLLYYLYRRHWNYQRYGSDASLQGPFRHELSNTRATATKPLKPPPSPIELPAGEIAAEKDAVTPPPPVYSSPGGYSTPVMLRAPAAHGNGR